MSAANTASKPAPPPLEDTAPADRFCDLVMKGGITSGVVYPGAIIELAKAYRFKSIGGTSAGALAAAITAAAEYRRRVDGSMAGFGLLRDLPDQLGESVRGRSRLLSLLQPEPATKRLFDALLSMLNRHSTASRWWFGTLGFLNAYWLFALPGLILGALLGAALSFWWSDTVEVLGTVLLGLLGTAAGVGFGIYHDLARGVAANGFGLCRCGPVVPPKTGSSRNLRGGSGSAGAQAVAPTLVPWLHELIQRTAGRKPGDAPLTFEDLWHAPGFPPEDWKAASAPDRPERSIDLQMFTTNLTHGRPYQLPLHDDTSRLFFKAEQLESYFPADVIEHLSARARPYEKRSPSDPDADKVDPALLELPYGALPIVVAVRLGLSFPLLISAVPLWAIDHDSERSARTMGQCWFSDGGICSNFPIHLFDRFVPRWPTFAINLEPRGARADEQRTWVPDQEFEGRADSWNRFADDPSAIGRLGGFLAAVVSSAQNWNDATGSRMPGVRDRIAHVRLEKNEGGLNLDMPRELIEALSSYGAQAGTKLREKFAAAPGQPPTRGWREHRWVRFNVTVFALRERLRLFGAAAHGGPYSTDLEDEIRAALSVPPLQNEACLNAAQAQALERLLYAIEDAETAFALADVPQPYVPLPEPVLRVRAPL